MSQVEPMLNCCVKFFREIEVAERCNEAEDWAIKPSDEDDLETRVNRWLEAEDVFVLNQAFSEHIERSSLKITTFRTLSIVYQYNRDYIEREMHFRRLLAITTTDFAKEPDGGATGPAAPTPGGSEGTTKA